MQSRRAHAKVWRFTLGVGVITGVAGFVAPWITFGAAGQSWTYAPVRSLATTWTALDVIDLIGVIWFVFIAALGVVAGKTRRGGIAAVGSIALIPTVFTFSITACACLGVTQWIPAATIVQRVIGVHNIAPEISGGIGALLPLASCVLLFAWFLAVYKDSRLSPASPHSKTRYFMVGDGPSERLSDPTTVARMARINGERPLIAMVGAAGSTREYQMSMKRAIGEWSDMTVPGVEELRGNSRRVILVTDQAIRVFRGKRFGRIGKVIGTYPPEAALLMYDDVCLFLPNGVSVALPARQAQSVVAAVGGTLNQARAHGALRRLGVSGELGKWVIVGFVPGSAHRTLKDVVRDLSSSGGFKSKSVEKRLVLISDKYVRIFCADMVYKLQSPIAVLAMGSQLSIDAATVSFPDGTAIAFESEKAAATLMSEATPTTLE